MEPTPLTTKTLMSLLALFTSLMIFLPSTVLAVEAKRRVKRCGTPNPPFLVRQATQARMERRQQRHRELNVKPSCQELCLQCISIEVYFHLLAFDTSDGVILPHPTDTYSNYIVGAAIAEDLTSVPDLVPLLNEQIAYINQAYEDTPFLFVDAMSNDPLVHTPDDTDWVFYAEDFSTEISQAYHVGNDNTLNVYLVYNAGSSEDDGGSTTVGFATLPSEQLGNMGDGVFMRYDTLPGGGLVDIDQGETLVHEVGHWLGLYHVFQETSGTTFVETVEDPCDPKNAGDFVSDTAQMATDTASYISALNLECYVNLGFDTDACNITCFDFLNNSTLIPDTCSGRDNAADPVFNYMNYVDYDACFQAAGYFTCGQVERMYMHYKLFREHLSGCANRLYEKEIEIVVSTDYNLTEDSDCEGDMKFSLTQLKADKSATNIMFSSTDSVNDFYSLDSRKALVIDLCVPRGDTYVFAVTDKPGDPMGTVLFEVWADGKLVKRLEHNKNSARPQIMYIQPPAKVPVPAPAPKPVAKKPVKKISGGGKKAYPLYNKPAPKKIFAAAKEAPKRFSGTQSVPVKNNVKGRNSVPSTRNNLFSMRKG